MNAAPKPELIELWIRANGRWQPFESFDPSSPQFACSRAPADYAWFVARRMASLVLKADPRIKAYALRRGLHETRRWRR